MTPSAISTIVRTFSVFMLVPPPFYIRRPIYILSKFFKKSSPNIYAIDRWASYLSTITMAKTSGTSKISSALRRCNIPLKSGVTPAENVTKACNIVMPMLQANVTAKSLENRRFSAFVTL